MGKIGGLIFLAGVVGTCIYLVSFHSASTIQQVQNQGAQLAREPRATLTDRRSESVVARNLGRAPSEEPNLSPNMAQVQTLARQMDQLSTQQVQGFDAAVDRLAQGLTLSDGLELEKLAIDGSVNHSKRSLSVYLLSQRPEMFAHQLEAIAGSESPALTAPSQPHTVLEVQHHFEEALRWQALGALDKLNLIDNREKPYFTQLQDTHTNASIRKLARMGMVGAEQKLALINRYLDTVH